MLGTHAAFVVTYEAHHERIDQIVEASVEVFIFVAFDTNVQVKISIAEMTISNGRKFVLFLLTESRSVFDDLLCRLYALVEVLWHQADVILETVAVADSSWGHLLSEIPDLLELLHILCNYSIDDAILCDVEKLE